MKQFKYYFIYIIIALDITINKGFRELSKLGIIIENFRERVLSIFMKCIGYA